MHQNIYMCSKVICLLWYIDIFIFDVIKVNVMPKICTSIVFSITWDALLFNLNFVICFYKSFIICILSPTRVFIWYLIQFLDEQSFLSADLTFLVCVSQSKLFIHQSYIFCKRQVGRQFYISPFFVTVLMVWYYRFCIHIVDRGLYVLVQHIM